MADAIDPVLLLDACRQGQPAARRAASGQLGGFLLRVAAERLRSKPDLAEQAEDCAQEALVAIWRKLEAGGGPDRPERFLSWSAAVVVHKVYDLLRRQGYGRPAAASLAVDPIPERVRRVPRAAQLSLEALGADSADSGPRRRLPDPSALDPEAEAGEREAFAALLVGAREHARLSEDSKRVLGEGFLDERDDDELARSLGTSRANVHVIRSRNLAKLRGDTAWMAQLRRFYEG